jgi:hypothetical protein
MKVIYYASTGLISLAMIFSAYSYFFNPELVGAFASMGFPDFLRVELGIAKGLAAVALWLPYRFFRDAAYFGLWISFISAFIAHAVLGHPVFNIIYPGLIAGILGVSYWSRFKLDV